MRPLWLLRKQEFDSSKKLINVKRPELFKNLLMPPPFGWQQYPRLQQIQKSTFQPDTHSPAFCRPQKVRCPRNSKSSQLSTVIIDSIDSFTYVCVLIDFQCASSKFPPEVVPGLQECTLLIWISLQPRQLSALGRIPGERLLPLNSTSGASTSVGIEANQNLKTSPNTWDNSNTF